MQGMRFAEDYPRENIPQISRASNMFEPPLALHTSRSPASQGPIIWLSALRRFILFPAKGVQSVSSSSRMGKKVVCQDAFYILMGQKFHQRLGNSCIDYFIIKVSTTQK